MFRLIRKILPILLLFVCACLFAEEREFITFSVKAFTTRSSSGDVFYGEDVAGAITNTLQSIDGIKVFERNANWSFLEELKLNMSGMVDNSDHEQKAEIISPDYFIEGEVVVSSGQMIIRDRVYETSSREVVYAGDVRGFVDEFFDLEDALVTELKNVFSQMDFKTRRMDTAGFERSAYDFYNKSLNIKSTDDRIALLKEALSKDQNFTQALHLLAATYDEASMRVDCTNTYYRILELDPNDFTARWNLAINLFKMKRLSEARKEFNECAKLRANDAEVWYNIGVLSEYDKDGKRFGPGVDLLSVIPNYEKVIELNEFHENAIFALGFIYGQMASSSNDIPQQQKFIIKALDYWEKFIYIAPTHSQVAEIKAQMEVFEQYLRQTGWSYGDGEQ